jgi:hypothetical protein
MGGMRGRNIQGIGSRRYNRMHKLCKGIDKRRGRDGLYFLQRGTNNDRRRNCDLHRLRRRYRNGFEFLDAGNMGVDKRRDSKS